ncbi:MAG: sulfatase-like hydrolase/transferase [Calditrichaeota bacterium]|nr:sulfatase-like hydrolase/transferase [Calditrichota bacterium]
MKKLNLITLTLVTAGLLFFAFSCQKSYPVKAKRVILLGIDAFSTDGLQTAETPNLDRLIREGALSLKARGVMPTVSAPNWGSMLLGAGPEQHGITKNGWKTDYHTIEPTVADSQGFFPSVFEVLKKNRPNLKIAAFFDWAALGDLFNNKYADKIEITKDFRDTYRKAIPYIISEKPDFTFIYVGHVDEVGHAEGHGTPEYYQSVTEVDAQIGKLISALEKAGMYDETHFIVISDHGGVGRGHGGESMAEIQVPWIIRGPGVIKNRLIEQPMNTFDTAPTIAFLFNVPQPDCWIGRPVFGAFERMRQSAMNKKFYVPKPVSAVKSGIYTKPKELNFSVRMKDAEIHYTLDGTQPQKSSPLFKKPIKLEKSQIIKAAAFKDDCKSETVTVDFNLVQKVSGVRLKNQPSPKYPAQGALSLVDGRLGNSDYQNPAWLGFEQDDLNALIDLGKIKQIDNVTIRFLKNEGSWIFLPTEVRLAASKDGRNFKLVTKLNREQIEQSPGRAIKRVKLNAKGIKTRYLKIFAGNIGVCPPNHPGAGGKAWLFTDEILIE